MLTYNTVIQLRRSPGGLVFSFYKPLLPSAVHLPAAAPRREALTH